MTEAVNTMKNLVQMIWNALDNVNVPVFGVSFLVFFIGIFSFNLVCLLLSTITGGKQDQEQNAKLDNNNHYIYRR